MRLRMCKVYKLTLTQFTQFLILFVLAFTACKTPAPFTQEEAYQENVQYLKTQAYDNWNKRINRKNATVATFFLEKVHYLEPDNLEIALLLSRAYHFEGYYIETDPAQKDSLFMMGIRLAIQIVEQSEVFQNAKAAVQGDSMVKVTEAVAVVEKKYLSALYWWAANRGRYFSTKPVRMRLEYRELGEALMHRVLALDPEFFYGGPYRFFGALYARLPGVELSRSEEYFQKAIAAYPDYLGTYVLRAQFLHTKAGDREKFKADLEYVINADPALLPDAMPENLFEQKFAEELLANENMLFE